MFEFLFSGIWLFVSIILFIVMCVVGLWPGAIFAALFSIIGWVFLGIGMRKFKRNRATEKHGILTYGIILSIRNSGCYVNDQPELKADVLIEKEGICAVLSETIGLDPYKYREGQFLRCKYFNDDINILGAIDSQNIPRDIFITLRDEYNYRCGIDERSRQYFNELNKTRAINDNWDKDLKHDDKNGKSWEHVDSNYDW